MGSEQFAWDQWKANPISPGTPFRLRQPQTVFLDEPFMDGRLQRQITIRLDVASVDYFKHLAAGLGIPNQNLINLYLRDCAANKRRPKLEWPEGAGVS